MMDTTYVFVTKDEKIYKKTKNDRSKFPWDVYDPKIGLWIAEEDAHPEFTDNDYISMEKAYAIKRTLTAKAGSKTIPKKDKQFNTPQDYVGEYIYFENSDNLYKVRNYRLDSDLYKGNGSWKQSCARLTIVGVKNNRVTKDKAEEIIKRKDKVIASPVEKKKSSGLDSIVKSYMSEVKADRESKDKASTEVTTVEKGIEKELNSMESGKYINRYFMDKGRLIKTVNYSNSNRFKDRYTCSQYIGHGVWQHLGFYSGSTLEHKILSNEEADKRIRSIDTTNDLPRVDLSNLIEESPMDLNEYNSSSKSTKNETITYTSNDLETHTEDERGAVEENKETNLELKIGAYFVMQGYLFKVTHMQHKYKIVYADYLSCANAGMVPWGDPIPFDDARSNLISSDDALDRIAKAIRPQVNDCIVGEEAVKHNKELETVVEDIASSIENSKLEEIVEKTIIIPETLEEVNVNLETSTSTPRIKSKVKSRCLTVKVPVLIRENKNVNVWIDHTLKSCTVEEIIDHEAGEYNIAVENARASNLAELFIDDLFSRFKNIYVSKEKMTELIQDKLEESYVKLRVNISGCTSKYIYLSQEELERSLNIEGVKVGNEED